MLTLTEDDLGVLERAAHLEKSFQAGIFPRGSGYARFNKLRRHGLLTFTGHGRDIDGEIETEVAVYAMTPLARVVLKQRDDVRWDYQGRYGQAAIGASR